MHRTHQQLTRKCSACGQIKPLASFLQSGSGYGDICAECRAAELDAHGSTSKGLRVDDKAKNLAELEQKKRLQELKELKQEDLEKRDKVATEIKDKRESTHTSEKKHREQYLDIKKALQTPQDKKLSKNKAAETTVLTNQHNQDEIVGKEIGEKTEQIKTGVDLTTALSGEQIFHAKFRGTDFLRMKQWLGTSAQGMKAFDNSSSATPAEKTTTSDTHRSSNLYQPAPKTDEPKQPAQSNESLVNHMKNVWGSKK